MRLLSDILQFGSNKLNREDSNVNLITLSLHLKMWFVLQRRYKCMLCGTPWSKMDIFLPQRLHGLKNTITIIQTHNNSWSVTHMIALICVKQPPLEMKVLMQPTVAKQVLFQSQQNHIVFVEYIKING